jgi:hypothetical protein
VQNLFFVMMKSSRYITVYHLKGLRHATPDVYATRAFKVTLKREVDAPDYIKLPVVYSLISRRANYQLFS